MDRWPSKSRSCLPLKRAVVRGLAQAAFAFEQHEDLSEPNQAWLGVVHTAALLLKAFCARRSGHPLKIGVFDSIMHQQSAKTVVQCM